MNVVITDLPGVLIIELRVFGDDRGFFYTPSAERSIRWDDPDLAQLEDAPQLSGKDQAAAFFKDAEVFP